MIASFFSYISGEKQRNVMRNDVPALPHRFPSSHARGLQGQSQSQCGKTHPSRYACRLGVDGCLPLGRHFSRFAHGVPGTLRAWAPPLGGFADVTRSSRTECGIGAGRATSTILESRCDSSPVARALGRGCKGGAQALTRWDAGLCPPLENRSLGAAISPGGEIFRRLPPVPESIAGAMPSMTTAARRLPNNRQPLPCPIQRFLSSGAMRPPKNRDGSHSAFQSTFSEVKYG